MRSTCIRIMFKYIRYQYHVTTTNTNVTVFEDHLVKIKFYSIHTKDYHEMVHKMVKIASLYGTQCDRVGD